MINLIASAGTHVAEYLADLGLDVGKKHINRKLDERKLHKSLMKYIEQHRRYNEMCSLAEEIDFQGLMKYIDEKLLDDVVERVFSPTTEQRTRARESIIDRAIAFSKANTDEARRRVSRLIAPAIDIIRKFYEDDIDIKDWIIAEMIVEEVAKGVHESERNLSQQIDSQRDILVSKMDTIQHTLDSQLSPETFLNLAKQGNFSGIEDRLSLIATAISKGHPLAPDYGFDLQLKSQPLTPEAYLKYPPKFACRGIVKMGGEIIHEITTKTLDYADRHQLKITLEITDAKKLLGEVEDPSQTEAKQLIGKTIIRKPKEFPPAFPCNIQMNGEIVYDYVMLRTEEILDDGTYIVSNKEQQNCSIRIKLTFNLDDRSQKINYSVSTQGKVSNSEYLRFIKLIKAASERGDLVIYVLNLGTVLMGGYTDPFEYKSGFENIDEEIDFFSRICDIEKYCGKAIAIPEEITEREYSQIRYLSELIRGGENEFTWSSQTFQGIVTQGFRSKITQMGDDFYELAFIGSSSAQLYGVDIEIPIIRVFREAKIKDFDRFKKKLEYTDDNETIAIVYIAGEDNTIVDKMKPDNQKEDSRIGVRQ